ncbi:ADP-ribosyl-(dinitrogen reductase) hydrolase [Burkholderia gladioli]|uniref:ADP-ribosyl-(dinitrogen reductase) hydrolase n=1 Tax=Burkholderia gladioli TaxID=28095 RepID=UPI00163EC750|nr:ADP-ribosyl-(dinitrogen reductase) hydrolase [Burkholderia gladioli]
MGLDISRSVLTKLANKTPPVTRDEIIQCFANRCGETLLDTREENRTDPPTRWFIAETDFGRKLKIVYIQQGHLTTIRTAYVPDQEELRIYQKYGLSN